MWITRKHYQQHVHNFADIVDNLPHLGQTIAGVIHKSCVKFTAKRKLINNLLLIQTL